VRKRRFVLTRTRDDRAYLHRVSVAAASAAAVASAETTAVATTAAAESAKASAKYHAAVATVTRANEEATNASIAEMKEAEASKIAAAALACVKGQYLAAADSVAAAHSVQQPTPISAANRLASASVAGGGVGSPPAADSVRAACEADH